MNIIIGLLIFLAGVLYGWEMRSNERERILFVNEEFAGKVGEDKVTCKTCQEGARDGLQSRVQDKD